MVWKENFIVSYSKYTFTHAGLSAWVQFRSCNNDHKGCKIFFSTPLALARAYDEETELKKKMETNYGGNKKKKSKQILNINSEQTLNKIENNFLLSGKKNKL